MSKYRLSEKHPVVKQIEKLFDMMDDLGVSIELDQDPTKGFSIHVDGNFWTFHVEDLEPGHRVDTLPPEMEYKITYEKPEEGDSDG